MIVIKTNKKFFLNEDIHVGMDIRKLYKIQSRFNRILKSLQSKKYKVSIMGDKIGE